MTILFISDLHLDESRPDITLAFFNFLETTAKGVDALYILGDFFEVWLGDDDQNEFNQSIIAALNKYASPLFLMHGNRDFLLGDEFCRQTAGTLLADPTVINLFGEHVLLMHGDSLCTQDAQYMKVRLMLRDQAFQKDLLSKTLQERKVIAKTARSQSKAHTRESKADIMDVTQSEVELIMAQHQLTTLIHGHTHRPKIHQLQLNDKPAKRIVLGDWDKDVWYLQCSPSGQTLKSYPIPPFS
jgi:UDP-2,3-diacylglucosamine hydrolase